MQQDYTAFTEYLSLIMADKAQLAQLAHRDPLLYGLCRDWVAVVEGDRPKTVSPFPAVSDLTAVQACIFDNWPTGQKVTNHPSRYVMAIEFWTAPADKIKTHRVNNWQRKTNASLWNATQLRAWLRKTLRENAGRKNPLSEAYLTKLVELSEAMEPEHLIGLLAEKGGQTGTVYFEFQYVLASLKDSVADAVISLDADSLPLPPFSDKQANGISFKQTAGNAILQSRADLSGFSTNWATDGEVA